MLVLSCSAFDSDRKVEAIPREGTIDCSSTLWLLITFASAGTRVLIYPVSWRPFMAHKPARRDVLKASAAFAAGVAMGGFSCVEIAGAAPRSEERRVGKECRSRW